MLGLLFVEARRPQDLDRVEHDGRNHDLTGARFVISSGIRVTPSQIGATMSRLMPRRITAFCLCALLTAGTCALTFTPPVTAIKSSSAARSPALSERNCFAQCA